MRSQINSAIADLTVIHKGDWKEYFIGRLQQCYEHSSKLFFQCMNATPVSMRKLRNANNEVEWTDNGILNICTNFYDKLLSGANVQEIDDAATEQSFSSDDSSAGDTPYCFIPDADSPKLNLTDQTMLDEEVSYEEL